MTRSTLRAARARSATQQTIGFPAISIRAFPGRRVDARRAGTMATVRFTGQQLSLRQSPLSTISPRHEILRSLYKNPDEIPDYFFRVAAAFFAERDRDAAERFLAALRA